jgi:hypothetical protein
VSAGVRVADEQAPVVERHRGCGGGGAQQPGRRHVREDGPLDGPDRAAVLGRAGGVPRHHGELPHRHERQSRQPPAGAGHPPQDRLDGRLPGPLAHVVERGHPAGAGVAARAGQRGRGEVGHVVVLEPGQHDLLCGAARRDDHRGAAAAVAGHEVHERVEVEGPQRELHVRQPGRVEPVRERVERRPPQLDRHLVGRVGAGRGAPALRQVGPARRHQAAGDVTVLGGREEGKTPAGLQGGRGAGRLTFGEEPSSHVDGVLGGVPARVRAAAGVGLQQHAAGMTAQPVQSGRAALGDAAAQPVQLAEALDTQRPMRIRG